MVDLQICLGSVSTSYTHYTAIVPLSMLVYNVCCVRLKCQTESEQPM